MPDTMEVPVNTDRAYELDAEYVTLILDATHNGHRAILLGLLEPLHAADQADLLEQINAQDRNDILTLWGTDINGGVLSELEEGVRDEVLEFLPDPLLAAALRDLEADDLVDIVEDLDEPQQTSLLGALDDNDRHAVHHLLSYPEDTAGRLMQRELVLAPDHWRVADVLDFLRDADDLPEQFYDVIVVNAHLNPVGRLMLDQLVVAKRKVKLTDIMDEEFIIIPVAQSQEDVAYAFHQYHMVSAPVVDGDNRLVGVITIDDAMEVLDDEAEEDMKRLAGVGDENLSDNVFETAKLRFPWLAVNLLTSVLASMVIAQFASVIETIVALAVLMPIVASMGGNAGTQTLTVAVRALATKDLTSANAWRVVKREGFVGLINGIVFAVLIGAIGVAWYGSPMLGYVLGMAMIGNMVVAGLAGVLVPIILDKLKIDPALASGAFVTTVTDIFGFLVFLGLAAWLLI